MLRIPHLGIGYARLYAHQQDIDLIINIVGRGGISSSADMTCGAEDAVYGSANAGAGPDGTRAGTATAILSLAGVGEELWDSENGLDSRGAGLFLCC
jgi:hypothetical protein